MDKYTVIIPTRDRAETLGATICSCLRQTYENFEIIVSDNCSSDNTKEIVYQFKDPRIKYINPGQRLSMSGNFEFALGHVTEGFVMFIGSDDGIMPDAIHYVDSIIKKYNVDAVSCQQAVYVWPSFLDKTIAGKLSFGASGNEVEIRNSQEWIKKTLAFPSMYCFQLPNLYCGFVNKRIIDRAYKDKRYFRSITPDAYSAFATAIFTDKYAFSYRPFCIAGASSKSNGASSLHKVADDSESKKFHVENDIEFCDGFVNCPSFEVICVETFAQLAKAFPMQCKKFDINYSSMLYLALKNANQRTAEKVSNAVEIMARNFSVKVEFNLSLLRSKIDLYLRRCYRAFRIIIGSSQISEIDDSFYLGIHNVDDAALVAHVMMTAKYSGRISTNKSVLFNRIKKHRGI